MINQPEERPLSIGSAVQFTHKGKTMGIIYESGEIAESVRGLIWNKCVD